MDTNEEASRYRLRIRDQVAELGQLAEMAMGRGPLVRGSFYAYRRRCGKPGCRCARGQLHRGQAFGVSEGGRTLLVPLGGIDAHALAEHVEAYRRVRRARADMVRICAKLVGTVDRLLHLREIPVGRLRRPGSLRA